MAIKEEILEHPKNVIVRDFSDIKSSYANQSMLQATDDDISMVFGETAFNDDGELKIKFNNSVRMSKNHFRKFMKNCNALLEEMDK